MSRETPVKDSLVVFVEGARVNFDMWGQVAPMFGANVNGKPRLEPVTFATPQDKEKFRSKIESMIADGVLKEFVLVAECWTADGDIDAIRECLRTHGTLEKYDGRREAVQVLYCSPSEEICYTASIDRGNIPATLGEWRLEERPRFSHASLNTRFQGLFAKSKAGSN